ncbi:MAG: DUF2442 domain-containing protein [Bacteroidales bacterium]|nr:DUF2442 domain-containing protein [Bacteroidales bacterium]
MNKPINTIHVWFDEFRLFVRLEDGREIAVPLNWFPRLRDAGGQQRKNWRFVGGGEGIRWEEIDEDILVEGLLK